MRFWFYIIAAFSATSIVAWIYLEGSTAMFWLYVVAGILTTPIGMRICHLKDVDFDVLSELMITVYVALICLVAWPAVILCWLYIRDKTQ